MIVDNWHANVDVFAIVEALSVSSYTTTIHENIHRPPQNLKLRWRWCSLLASWLATVSGIAFMVGRCSVYGSVSTWGTCSSAWDAEATLSSRYFLPLRDSIGWSNSGALYHTLQGFVTGKTWASSDRGWLGWSFRSSVDTRDRVTSLKICTTTTVGIITAALQQIRKTSFCAPTQQKWGAYTNAHK